jgi:asparaginyl-tRNA synthetase
VNDRDPAQRPDFACQSVRVLGASVDFPIAKKQHKLETLRTVELAHLRPRTNTIAAVARVRSALAFATHEFFNTRGFQYVHTPLITASDCEGAGEMFSVTSLLSKAEEVAKEKGTPVKVPTTASGKIDYSQDFFGKPSFLTVSGQLNVETYACALSDVYTFGPTFRAEYSFTSRHLSEFWMIEPEIAFADLETNMNLAEDYVKYCVTYALKNCRPDLEFFEGNVEEGLIERLLNVLAAPFQRITYTDAVNLLLQPEHLAAGSFEEAPFWGIDLGSEHERYLTERVFRKPTIVTDYPKDFKAFYMKQNDDGKTVRAMDILVPKIGELIGGSERESSLEKLTAMMVEKDVGQEGLKWYMDLRRWGTVPHSGFGLGFERLVLFVTGVENIRDVIPFPRWPKNADF